MSDNRMAGASDDEKFWQQITGDARRTLLCEPHRLDEFQRAVAQRGLGGVTVRASPACPEGKALVLDDSAMEASWRQTIQQAGRSLYR